MSKWKSYVGIILIVVSLIGLILWEQQGRQIFLMEPILVASKEVPAGTKLTADALTVALIPKENLVKGALGEAQKESLLGRCTKETLLQNQQLAASYFVEKGGRLEGGDSIFVIPKEWIVMRSSSLRKGDEIQIYGNKTCQSVGIYQTAFVKDQAEQEVTVLEGGLQSNALDRVNSTAEISHVEVVTTLREYVKIREMAAQEEGLLLVQSPRREAKLE